jgi:hypothetical protein
MLGNDKGILQDGRSLVNLVYICSKVSLRGLVACSVRSAFWRWMDGCGRNSFPKQLVRSVGFSALV